MKYILINLRLSSAGESRHSCCTRLYYPCIRNCHNILSTLTDEDFASEKKPSRLVDFSTFQAIENSHRAAAASVQQYRSDLQTVLHKCILTVNCKVSLPDCGIIVR